MADQLAEGRQTSPEGAAAAEGLIPAAQYLRMSSPEQQFSIDAQRARIKSYADAKGYVIVQTYEDIGRTGVVLKQRPGLIQLLQDITSGNAAYRAILVYDISRWGRFQDTDEAAHYEFICKSAGVPVTYCAEPFVNGDDLPATIVKSLKRAMAAEYSRELGEKIFAGKANLAKKGFSVGGRCPMGYRRLLISSEGHPKRFLAPGEWKPVSNDRVILVPGPDEDVACIREIFRLVVEEKKRRGEIVSDLNLRGFHYRDGSAWNLRRVTEVLGNPLYAGANVWARSSQRLCGPCRAVDPEEWILVEGAFQSIVDPASYQRARALLRSRPHCRPETTLISDLRKILKNKGTLSATLINRSAAACCAETYRKRFGSLVSAYQQIDWPNSRSGHTLELTKRLFEVRDRLVRDIVARSKDELELSSTVLRRPVLESHQLNVRVVVLASPVGYQSSTKGCWWRIRPGKSDRDVFHLVARLAPDRRDIDSLFLFPPNVLTRDKLAGSDDPCWSTATRFSRVSRFTAILRRMVAGSAPSFRRMLSTKVDVSSILVSGGEGAVKQRSAFDVLAPPSR